MKVAIIGYSGSGKSTLAKYIGEIEEIPVLFLDKVQFTANWQKRNRQEAIEQVSAFMNQESWIIDGNYTSFLQKERFEQADQIIFMDFPRLQCLIRAYKRYFIYRHKSRESVADRCIEKMDRQFVWWILYQGRTKKRRKHYKSTIQQYKEKTVVIKNQRQLERFMRNARRNR